jgi:SAM-dependent methyltransferase
MTLWTPSSILRRARQVWSDEGPLVLLMRVLGETGYRRVDVLERSLVGGREATSSEGGIRLGVLDAADLPAYFRLRPAADEGTIRRRLAGESLCVVAWLREELAGVTWLTRADRVHIDYLGIEIALNPDEAYLYESYTAPAARRRGLAGLRSLYGGELLRQAGCGRIVSVVVPENRAGRRAVDKVGARYVGRLGCIRVGPWRRTLASSACRWRIVPATGHAYWDAVAQEMAAQTHYLDPFLAEMKRSAHERLIARWGGLPPRIRVLKTDLFEEAMGDDGLLAGLSGEGRQVLGIDLSPEIAHRATVRRVGAAHVAAGVSALPFSSECFDLVVSPSTLDHFPDSSELSRSLREITRVLRPAGRLIITLDNRGNIFDPLLRTAGKLHLLPYYLGRSYTAKELRRELIACGLEVEEEGAILHNPRLVAVGLKMAVNRLGWRPLIQAVEWALRRAQGMEGRRGQYLSGSFVAALARRPGIGR